MDTRTYSMTRTPRPLGVLLISISLTAHAHASTTPTPTLLLLPAADDSTALVSAQKAVDALSSALRASGVTLVDGAAAAKAVDGVWTLPRAESAPLTPLLED